MTSQPESRDELMRRMKDDGVRHVQLEFTDFIGVARCRLVSSEVLARDGLPNFPWVNISHDVQDGEPDPGNMGPNSSSFWLSPDPASYAPLPYAPGLASVQCTLVNADGSRYAGCARTLVADYAARLEAEGFGVAMAFEPEGSVLRQESDGRWVYASAAPIFSTNRIAELSDFVALVIDYAQAMGMTIEKVSAEAGGTMEFNMPPSAPVTACDRLVQFRAAFKAAARQCGYLGTLVPRAVTNGPTCGVHVHLSIRHTETGRDALIDAATGTWSDAGQNLLSGLITHAASLTAAGSNSVNSFKRLVPGNSWTPTNAAWGFGNRSCFVRVVDDPPFLVDRYQAQGVRRLEVRCADGTCNPYVFAVAVLAAMLAGLSEHYPLPASSNVDWGIGLPEEEEQEASPPRLPRSVDEALSALSGDKVISGALGNVLVRGITRARIAERRAFQGIVTTWEQDQLFPRY
jgi:glutamine synthetase